MSDAFRRIGGNAKVLLTCEHASEALPERWSWPEADRRLLGSHWASDLGAAELTEELAASMDAEAILTRFSRLLIDPNRPIDSPTLIREHAEGLVELNQRVTDDDRQHRLENYYRAYHGAIDETLSRSSAHTIFAIHSFTPVYEGEPRAMEIGVLYDAEEELAARMGDVLREAGFSVALNEPYSGKAGMIYAADFHARRHQRRAIEIEVRQDLCIDPDFRKRLVEALTALFSA